MHLKVFACVKFVKANTQTSLSPKWPPHTISLSQHTQIFSKVLFFIVLNRNQPVWFTNLKLLNEILNWWNTLTFFKCIWIWTKLQINMAGFFLHRKKLTEIWQMSQCWRINFFYILGSLYSDHHQTNQPTYGHMQKHDFLCGGNISYPISCK